MIQLKRPFLSKFPQIWATKQLRLEKLGKKLFSSRPFFKSTTFIITQQPVDHFRSIFPENVYALNF